MIKRTLTYQLLTEYLKDLADAHNGIFSFINFSEKELANTIRTKKPTEYPAMVLFAYSGKLDGNRQRTFSTRSISFAIVSAIVKRDDFDAQYAAINKAEQIGLAVISRIAFDSQNPKNDWLYNNFDKNSVRFTEIFAKETDNLFGMEFHFDLKVPEPLVIDPSDWSDINTTC